MEQKEQRKPLGKLVKWLLVIAGSLSLGLGILGIILPVLPTTPFLLLSAACYVRGSARLYRWLLSTKHLGNYIRAWREKKGIALGLKISIISLMLITIAITVIFFINALWLRILLGVIALLVTYHILRLPTYRRGRNADNKTPAVERDSA
ncbi:YbaN family protein [bacterium]|nr:YbaN family protein [bacterium]